MRALLNATPYYNYTLGEETLYLFRAMDGPPAGEESLSELEIENSGADPFPGLNKSHGFFDLIKRNQQDRDSYHQQQEECKQVSANNAT